MRWINVVLAALIMTLPACANPGDGSKFSFNPAKLQLAQAMSQPQEEPAFEETTSVEIEGKLVPGKAVLLSGILPGAGQYYARNPIMAAAFLALEIGAWAGVAIYHKEGMDKEDEYLAYADKWWTYYDNEFSDTYGDNEFTYLEYEFWVAKTEGNDARSGNWLGELFGSETEDGWQDLTWEEKLEYLPSDGFTHEIDPHTKDQQYYEMVGKYDQFGAGWPDQNDAEADPFDGWKWSTFNQVRENYLNMRKDSNDALDMSKNFAMVVLGNHLLSAVHAGLSVTWHNRKLAREQGIEGAFNLEPKKYNNELVTMGVLRIKF